MTLTILTHNNPPCCECHSIPGYYALTEASGKVVSTICEPCTIGADGPGKYETFHNDDDRAKALLLQSIAQDSGEDEFCGSEGNYMALIDNFIWMEDDRGFIEFEEHKTTELARKTFDTYFAGGAGATEYDIYVSYEGRQGVELYDGDSHKAIPIHPDASGKISENRIDAALNLYMRDTGCYPNVWNNNHYGCELRKMKVISWL